MQTKTNQVYNRTYKSSYGITAIGVAIPKFCLPTDELAKLRNTDPNKYKIGLGCEEIAICSKHENVVTLGAKAAKRAIKHWGGSLEDIGLLAVGTETSIDMSRPLSAWIAESLNLKGAIRSYEVKHACYGATLALRQALEWKLSVNSKNKVALVVATDIALYAPGHPGEPTQGAGAIAFIIDQPTIAELDINSYYWSESKFDFWRPAGQAYPQVNGTLSVNCYNQAVVNCFSQLCNLNNLNMFLDKYKYLNFHVPFPKMVYKAFKYLGEKSNLSLQTINELFQTKVVPTLVWNKKIGNAYTASLWFSVAKSLTLTKPQEMITAFSYGSGFGAELLLLKCINNQDQLPWVIEFEKDLIQRVFLTAEEYKNFRKDEHLNQSEIVEYLYAQI